MTQRFLICLLGFVTIYSASLLANEEPLVGIVLTAQGPLGQLNESGESIALEAGTPLNVGQEITVGDESRAQFLFSDGTLISVAAGTKFTVTDYKFNMAGSDALKLQVANGTVRLLSGDVDRENSAGIKVFTPDGEVEVLGTLFTTSTSPAGTSLGFFEGSGLFKKPGFSRYLGYGAGFDYATIPRGQGQAIVATLGAPKVLASIESTRPSGGDAPTKASLASIQARLPIKSLTVTDIRNLKTRLRNDGPQPDRHMIKLTDRQVKLFYDGLCDRF